MKNKSKLMLVATSLLTVSIAASATSAFAWFTINRTAQVNLSNIAIKSDFSSLAVTPVVTDGKGGTDFVVTGEGTGEKGNPITLIQNSKLDPNKTLSDVTSDGSGTYHKPKISPNGSNIVGWYSEAQAGKFALSLDLKFTATGTNNLQIYLMNSSTAVDAVGAGPLASAKDAFRFSVQDSEKNMLLYATPYGAANADATYLQGSEEGQISTLSPQIVPDGKVASKANLYSSGFKQVTEHKTGEGATNDAAHGYLAEVKPGGNNAVTLTFNFWIEGTDADCKALAQSTESFVDALNISLNFYAVETAPAA